MRKDQKLLLILLAVLITLSAIVQFLQTGGIREGISELTVQTFLSKRVYSCNRYSIHENLLGNYVVVEYDSNFEFPSIGPGPDTWVSKVYVVNKNHADALTWGVHAIAAGTPLPELVQRIGIPVSNNDHHGNTIQYGSVFADALGNRYMVEWTDATRSIAASVSYMATQEHPTPVQRVWPHYLRIGLSLICLMAAVFWIVLTIRKSRRMADDHMFRPREDAAMPTQALPPVHTKKGSRRLKLILLLLAGCVPVFFILFSRYDTRGLLPGMEFSRVTYQHVSDCLSTRNHIIYENRFGKLVVVEVACIIEPISDPLSSVASSKKVLTAFCFADPLTTSRSLYAAASIQEGMHLTDVVRKLGKPDSAGVTGTSSSILSYNWDNYHLQITLTGDGNRVTNVKLTEISNGKIMIDPAFDPEFTDIVLMVRKGILLLFGVTCGVLVLISIDWRRKPAIRKRKPTDDIPENLPSDDEFDDDEGFRPIF